MSRDDGIPSSGGVPADVLRAAMRHLPTGVALLTAGRGALATGMSVNSLVSVSLEPPLVLVSVHRDARIATRLRAGEPFAVSVLSVEHADLTRAFAARVRPEGVGLTRAIGAVGENGVPTVAGAPAVIECTVERVVAAGDHRLVIGRVVAVRVAPADHPPQVFHAGALTTVDPTGRPHRSRGAVVNRDIHHVECAVVGGGPAGLLLALLLGRRGHEVVVVDRRDRLDAGGASYEPFLAPPSLELLDRLGLLDRVAPHGQPVRQVAEHDATGLRYLLDYSSAPGCPHPYALSVPLAVLTRVLSEALADEPTVAIMTGTTVRELVEHRGRYSLEVTRAGEDLTVRGDYVVGSDGKFSALRAMADIRAEVFEFDRPLVLVELPLPPGWPERITLHHDAGAALLATMPVAGGQLTVLWAGDPGEYEELRGVDVAALRARLAAGVPALAGPLAAALSDWDDVATVRHHVVQPEVWSRGNLCLLGDSAHGMHSFGAQGLNMAIQDAVVLADLIAGAAVGDRVDALSSYEALRRPFVERFQRYQMSLPVLSSSGREPVGLEGPARGLYEVISDVMTVGQPEVVERYPA